MADYAQAYDFAYFAPKPKVVTDPEHREFNPKVVVKKPKSERRVRTEERLSAQAAVKVVLVAVILFFAIGFNVYGKVILNERVHQLETVQTEIEVANSENIRLNNELNNFVSLSQVEKTASNKFHMVKRESSQVTYIEVGDKSNSKDAVVS